MPPPRLGQQCQTSLACLIENRINASATFQRVYSCGCRPMAARATRGSQSGRGPGLLAAEKLSCVVGALYHQSLAAVPGYQPQQAALPGCKSMVWSGVVWSNDSVEGRRWHRGTRSQPTLLISGGDWTPAVLNCTMLCTSILLLKPPTSIHLNFVIILKLFTINHRIRYY